VTWSAVIPVWLAVCGLCGGGLGALLHWALTQGALDRAYFDGYDDRRRWEQGPAADAREDMGPPPPGAAPRLAVVSAPYDPLLDPADGGHAADSYRHDLAAALMGGVPGPARHAAAAAGSRVRPGPLAAAALARWRR
jgi:hypothetical protein